VWIQSRRTAFAANPCADRNARADPIADSRADPIADSRADSAAGGDRRGEFRDGYATQPGR
jgi:hypothetical protein